MHSSEIQTWEMTMFFCSTRADAYKFYDGILEMLDSDTPPDGVDMQTFGLYQLEEDE